MKKNLLLGKTFILLAVLILSTVTKSFAGDAPPNMAAGLIIQLLSFEKNLMSTTDDITIHVVGSTPLADELKKSIGWQIAKRKLGKVTSSNALPTEKTDILVVSNSKIVSDAIAYTRANHIISVTNKPELVKKGVTLGIGMSDKGSQRITINMASAKEEGLNWNPAILKIAKAVK